MTPTTRWLARILGIALLFSGLAQAALYQMDCDPIGRLRRYRLVKKEIHSLASGTPEQKMWAARRLRPLGMGREDAREALLKALHDNNLIVSANAALRLRFYFGEPVRITSNTYKFSFKTPREPAYLGL